LPNAGSEISLDTMGANRMGERTRKDQLFGLMAYDKNKAKSKKHIPF
jgi:hypothetical protein